MKIRSLTFALLLLSLSLVYAGVGCNTVKGVGKDVTAAGDATERALTGDKPAANP